MHIRKLALLLLLFCASILLQGGGRQGGSALRSMEHNLMPPQMVDVAQYDDTIDLLCEELKNYVNFKGTKLDAVVRVKVICYCDTKENRFAPAKNFEDFWYRRGDPIGAKRLIPIPIKEQDRVAIFVKSKGNVLTEAEIAACANTLVLLRLQLSLNRNLVETVRVPDQSMQALVCELRKQNFLTYKEIGQEINSLIPIQLESDLGRKEVMCYKVCN